MQLRTLFKILSAVALPAISGNAWCQDAVTGAGVQEPAPARPGLAADIKDYFSAPLHWSGGEWAIFGGVLVATGAARHYDTQVRTHFITATSGTSSKDLQDALPTVAILGGTWAYAALMDSSAGRRETWDMVEAAGLSGVTAYALKFAVGRAGPDQTSDPSDWGKQRPGSFPSVHTTAAFAVGTVLAESGNDDYRWIRRLLGYGLGTVTAYERLKHNAHWLSDVVAGAALGAASAHFVMARREREDEEGSHVAVVPTPGGVMLTYTMTLR